MKNQHKFKERITSSHRNPLRVGKTNKPPAPDQFADVRAACRLFFISRGMDPNGYKFL